MAPSSETKKNKNREAQKRFRMRQSQKTAQLKDENSQLRQYVHKLLVEKSKCKDGLEEAFPKADLRLEDYGPTFDLGCSPLDLGMSSIAESTSPRPTPVFDDSPTPTAALSPCKQTIELESEGLESQTRDGQAKIAVSSDIYVDNMDVLVRSDESWSKPCTELNSENFDATVSGNTWQPQTHQEDTTPPARAAIVETSQVDDYLTSTSNLYEGVPSSLDTTFQPPTSSPWSSDDYWLSLSWQDSQCVSSNEILDPMKPLYASANLGFQDSCQPLRSILLYVQSILLSEQSRQISQSWSMMNPDPSALLWPQEDLEYYSSMKAVSS